MKIISYPCWLLQSSDLRVASLSDGARTRRNSLLCCTSFFSYSVKIIRITNSCSNLLVTTSCYHKHFHGGKGSLSWWTENVDIIVLWRRGCWWCHWNAGRTTAVRLKVQLQHFDELALFHPGPFITFFITLIISKHNYGDEIPQNVRHDIWVVGAGTLGMMAVKEWISRFPSSTIIAETRTDSRHAELVSMGVTPRLRSERTETQNDGVARRFCWDP